MWGWNSLPQGQESHALPMEPDRWPRRLAVFINVHKFMGLLGGLLSAGRLSGMEWSQMVSLICLVVRWVGQSSSVGLAHLLQSYHLVRLPGISLHGKKRTSSLAQLLFKLCLCHVCQGPFGYKSGKPSFFGVQGNVILSIT